MDFFAKEKSGLVSSGGAIPSLTAFGMANIGVCSTLEKCRSFISAWEFESPPFLLRSLGVIW